MRIITTNFMKCSITKLYRFSNVVFNNCIKVNTSIKELYNGVGATLITFGFLTSQITPLANIILFTTSDSIPFWKDIDN